MKKIIIMIVVALLSNVASSQIVFEAKYIKGRNSTFCTKVNYGFAFDSKDGYYYFIKVDGDSKEIIEDGPSKLESTGYDDNGLFYELRTPKYYLNQYGIDKFNSTSHFAYKIFYDKRGGNALLIYEHNIDTKSGIYYITEAGTNTYCK